MVMKNGERVNKNRNKKNHAAKSGEKVKEPSKTKQARSVTIKTETIVVDEYMRGIEEDDNAQCCVLVGAQPLFVQQYHSLIISKWVKCDFCPHCTHLIYCTSVIVIRRGDGFRCPHCTGRC